MNLALNCWFSQCYSTRILNAKLSPYYFTYLLVNLRFIYKQQDLLQMIRLFISEWDERCDWPQTIEHDVVWSIWAGDRGELGLSYAHLNEEWHAKSHELIGVFLVCPSDWARGPPLLWRTRGLPLPGCRTIVHVLWSWILFSRLSMLPSFQPLSENSLSNQHPSCTIPLWQIEIFLIRIASSCEIFVILILTDI